MRKRHIAQRQSALFINYAEHRVNIGIIQDQKTLRILHRMTVLLQHAYTEPMKRIDVSGVVIPGPCVNPLPHFIGCFVRERHAENISGQNPDLINQKREPLRQRPCLSRTGACDDPHHTFRLCYRFFLRVIESF